MCIGCWEEMGSPSILNDRTRYCAAILRACSDGGNLHIIVADFNLNDDDIDFCDKEVAKAEHSTAVEEILKAAIERTALKLLKPMTIEERASAMAIADGSIG